MSKRINLPGAVACSLLFVLTGRAPAQTSAAHSADYFESQTRRLEERCLSGIHTLADWEGKRAEYRRQLQEMLGLWPMPERTDLHPVVTGQIEQDDFVVEKIHFQASPRLHVTANLYRPSKVKAPLPAVLYVCGHARVVTNGVNCGNKAGYQHHGAWFARNGYVCLLVDTLQLGEIEGKHRGTHTEGQWWWNSRGYTPAGVEAWFGIRALDYLCSRPEVDKERIGMTGRSGGGSYTWTVAALDDRVKVAAPVAGITDMRNQVVDGAIEGHCDCMFFINTYRWDFPQVAALLAPRPLLIANSDKDGIFPLDGVIRLHNEVKRIYALYGKTNQLGLLITEGPHGDTQDLQLPVFRWFNRFLKRQDPVIAMAATKMFTPDQLRVFDELPADEINTRIQETFVAPAKVDNGGRSAEVLRQELLKQVFMAWPEVRSNASARLVEQKTVGGISISCYVLEPQPGVELTLTVQRSAKLRKPSRVLLVVTDPLTADEPLPGFPIVTGHDQATVTLRTRPIATVEAGWTKKKVDQARRRYALLGETVDSMRVYDIRCGVQALQALPEFRKAEIVVEASKHSAVNALYAALFEPAIAKLHLSNLPATQSDGPDYLNVLRVTTIPEVIQAVGPERVVRHTAGR